MVPDELLFALRYLLDFCYLVRRPHITASNIVEIEETLTSYTYHRLFVLETGIRDNFKLPRQHTLYHFPHLIREFGAPNGLCSSITESKHIDAVKKPWRSSNKFEALNQMILANVRSDKLRALGLEFIRRGYYSAQSTNDMHDSDDDDPYYGVDDSPMNLVSEINLAQCAREYSAFF